MSPLELLRSIGDMFMHNSKITRDKIESNSHRSSNVFEFPKAALEFVKSFDQLPNINKHGNENIINLETTNPDLTFHFSRAEQKLHPSLDSYNFVNKNQDLSRKSSKSKQSPQKEKNPNGQVYFNYVKKNRDFMNIHVKLSEEVPFFDDVIRE